MNDQNEKIIVSALAHYAPKPGPRFYHRMTKTPWNQKGQSMRSANLRRHAIGVAALLIAVIALSFTVPSVRAAVLKFLGLAISPSNTIPNPAIPVESLFDSQKVDEISKLAGWTINVPTWLPDGYHIDDITYDSSNKMVLITFLATRQLPGNDPNMTETKAMTLTQALRNDIIPLMVAPSTNVQDITVNDQPAAYAIGAWENDASTEQAIWNNSYSLQNAYWQTGNIFFNLNSDDAQVSKEDLIRVAGSTK
jgi:hypothetical protein